MCASVCVCVYHFEDCNKLHFSVQESTTSVSSTIGQDTENRDKDETIKIGIEIVYTIHLSY